MKKQKKNRSKHKKKHVIRGDLGTLINLICGKFNLIKLEYGFIDIFNELYKSVESKEPEQIIWEMIEKLETLIREDLKNFSVYEMFYFYRRIRPMNVYNCLDEEIISYRNTMSLAIKKYCYKQPGSFYSGGTYLPSSLKNIDVFEFNKYDSFMELSNNKQNKLKKISKTITMCYKLEIYCFYYNYLLKEYRTVCKGAKLKFGGVYGLYCISDIDLLKRNALYDKRSKYYNILTRVGGYGDTNLVKDVNDKLDNFIVLNFRENIEELDFTSFIHKKNQDILLENEMISNYIPIPISLECYFEYISNFKEEFIKYYKFSIEDFLIFIFILINSIASQMYKDNYYKFFMFQRAYNMHRYKDIKEKFIINYEKYCEIYKFNVGKNKEQTFEKIYNYLVLNENNLENINLKCISNHKPFIELCNEVCVCDYTSIVGICEELMVNICKDSNKKGGIFENIVIEKVREVFGNNSIWISQKKIKCKKGEREIDVSFVIDDVLIILECKSINISRGSYIGDRNSVKYRNEKNKIAIEQVDTILEFIIDNYKKLNVSLPENIKGIASLVVTPGPEYVWSMDDNLMINDEIPRIICIDELNYLKSNLIINSIKKRRFYKEL